MKVNDYMTSEVYTVQPETSAADAATILAAHSFGALPVVDENNTLVGIVSASDLVEKQVKVRFPTFFTLVDGFFMNPGALLDFEDDLKRANANVVEDIMTRDPLTVTPACYISEAATKISTNHIDQLPVVDKQNKVVGILSKSDILRSLLDDQAKHEQEAKGE